MLFNLAFHDRGALAESARRPVRSQWPHLRLVPLVKLEHISADLEALPAHTAMIVRRHVDAATLGSLAGVVSSDPVATAALLPHIPAPGIVNWDGVGHAYQAWMRERYLPFHRLTALYTPDGLTPVDAERESLSLEVVGGCGAMFVLHYAGEVGQQLDLDLVTSFVAHNHPVEVARAPSPAPDVQLVMAPLRFMHPETIDDFVTWSGYDRRLEEVIKHLGAYLDRVAEGLPARQRFVTGFMEPVANPIGFDFDRGTTANFKVFVRRLNDYVAAWCDQQASTWFVDASEISAAIGRGRTDEELVRNVAHRSTANPMDDWVDEEAVAEYPVADSYDMQTAAYYQALLRHVFHRRTTILGRHPVKLVITDLDNTLWRGLASNGRLGPWAGRPAGIAEALRVLRRRGILLAIASKNDRDYIVSHWRDLMGEMSDEPLGMNLDLDEFVAAKIGFQPKSTSVHEILEATNIDASNAVFIDDNALEREEVQAAFPRLRVLGTELNYVRRELLYSPYTQRHVLTEDDTRRTETTRARVTFYERTAAGQDGASYLHTLRLRLSVHPCSDMRSDVGRRCVQLINRANQWNLSGDRVDEDELAGMVGSGERILVYGKVEDAASSYGIVAAALVDPVGREVSDMVVSCRVIGMGVDDALMSAVLAAFGPVRLRSVTTERNRAAQDFMSRHCQDDNLLVACPAPAHIETTSLLVSVPAARLEEPVGATGRVSRPLGAKFDWLIVGAGLSGATMAERIATQLGQKVLIIDRRDHIAGNAFDAEGHAGIRAHRYGAHIFHTKSERVWRYLSDFTGWLPYVHRVLADVDGQLVPMPCNLGTLERLLGPSTAKRVADLAIAEFGAGAKVPVLSLVQHAHPDLRAAGDLVYRALFLGYTTKQWGMRPEDLDRSVTGRVPIVLSHEDRYFVDPYQGIPTDGYTAMVERMTTHPNIAVELGRNYRDLSDELRCARTVYTGPIDEFFNYRHGPLPYRSLRFEDHLVMVDRVQPVAVINHPGGTAYTRVIEHAHFADQHRGRTVLTYEFPEPHEPGANEPYYPVPRPENHRLYRLYAEDAVRLAGNVYFVGRLAEYRYYDMDQAVAHALALFDHALPPAAAAPGRPQTATSALVPATS